jgi:DNA-binding NtrC family response regulator
MGNRPKVLVIDTPEYIGGLEKTVARDVAEKWELIFATEPKQAFDILQGNNISVVLCGIGLPGINCLSLAEEIAKYFSRVNVILNGASTRQRIARKEFVQSKAFDIVTEEEDYNIVESIEVALAARRIQDTDQFRKPR